jgi:hypothetical protein
MLPDPVYHHASKEWILAARQPLGQLQAAAGFRFVPGQPLPTKYVEELSRY